MASVKTTKIAVFCSKQVADQSRYHIYGRASSLLKYSAGGSWLALFPPVTMDFRRNIARYADENPSRQTKKYLSHLTTRVLQQAARAKNMNRRWRLGYPDGWALLRTWLIDFTRPPARNTGYAVLKHGVIRGGGTKGRLTSSRIAIRVQWHDRECSP